MAAFKRIRDATMTAMRLLDGARNPSHTPNGTVSLASTGSYAPATPLNAALGPAAARMVGKDTSSLFKKIEDLNKNHRRF